MELLKLAVQIAIGLAAGGFTAAGYFAVITSVGMINRIVDVTNTKAYIPYFEEVIIWGASLGNGAWRLHRHSCLPSGWYP